jgi:hypothetical protein
MRIYRREFACVPAPCVATITWVVKISLRHARRSAGWSIAPDEAICCSNSVPAEPVEGLRANGFNSTILFQKALRNFQRHLVRLRIVAVAQDDHRQALLRTAHDQRMVLPAGTASALTVSDWVTRRWRGATLLRCSAKVARRPLPRRSSLRRLANWLALTCAMTSFTTSAVDAAMLIETAENMTASNANMTAAEARVHGDVARRCVASGCPRSDSVPTESPRRAV